MKIASQGIFASVLCGMASADTNPISKVLELLSDLQAKVIRDGEAESKSFDKYADWCEDHSRNTQFAIKTATSSIEKLTANIQELSGQISAGTTNIEELSGSIATIDHDLTQATKIRDEEHADFVKMQDELSSTSATLDRAIGHLSRSSGNTASLTQLDGLSKTTPFKALSMLVDASILSTADAEHLQSLLQASSDSDDADLSFGAPAAKAYESHGGDILAVLGDLKDKADVELSDLRKAEINNKNNFQMLEQSLTDEKKADNKDMQRTKANVAKASEDKATSEGDLANTQAELKVSKEDLEATRLDCIKVATDHEASVKARGEELHAIAEAKKVLEETSSGASSQTYSFLELNVHMKTRADLARSEVLTIIRNLARKESSPELTQLAAQVASISHLGGSEDQFEKIKALIRDMLRKLEEDANTDATEKAYCDKELAHTQTKRDELNDDVSKMQSQRDQAAARSAELQESIKQLNQQLAHLARSQAEMDKLRHETHANFKQTKADLDLGLSGVRKALLVLKEYFASNSAALLQTHAHSSMHQPATPTTYSKSEGAGGGIVGILEVVESDFVNALAKAIAEEEDAQSEYETASKENEISKTSKDQDVKYKSQEVKSLKTDVSELDVDLESTHSELSAVLEYHGKLRGRCIAKPETYEERTQRRAAELAGLNEALQILEDETAFVQRKTRKIRIRGSALMP